MFYSITRAVIRLLFLCLGLRTEGMENIPSSGPVIIAPNHVSNWDPVIVGISMKRPVYFMAKASLFKYSFSDYVFRKLNAFPVRTEYADRQAIGHALQVLREGKMLGIFPQGTRSKSGNAKAQAGVVMIALKSGAPIIPIACLGTGHFFPCGWFNPLVVKAGRPIYVENKGPRIGSAGMEKISEEIMNEINDLLVK